MDECFHKTKCGQPFLLLKDSEDNVTVEAYIGNNKLFGDLDQTVRESHKISDQDLWSILTKDSTIDKQFFWKLDHNQNKLMLFQELGLDETSTIQWAVFNLERDDLTVESAVELINRMMSEISETNKALVDRDSEMKMLGDRCEEMQAAMNEHTSKADIMESNMFHHFTEILNSKKRKIRHLNQLMGPPKSQMVFQAD